MKTNLKIIVFILSMMLSIIGFPYCLYGIMDSSVTKIEFAYFLLIWFYIIAITIVTYPDKKE